MPEYDWYAYPKDVLDPIDSFDAREPDYSFDIILAVREKATGRVYLADDSGCSCPIPFEDHVFPDTFTPVNDWSTARSYIEQAYPGAEIPADFRAKVVAAIQQGPR